MGINFFSLDDMRQGQRAENERARLDANQTTDDRYGDGSIHVSCPVCGFCRPCGDCKCPKPVEPARGHKTPEAK